MPHMPSMGLPLLGSDDFATMLSTVTDTSCSSDRRADAFTKLHLAVVTSTHAEQVENFDWLVLTMRSTGEWIRPELVRGGSLLCVQALQVANGQLALVDVDFRAELERPADRVSVPASPTTTRVAPLQPEGVSFLTWKVANAALLAGFLGATVFAVASLF